MSMTIWKWSLPLQPIVNLEMPWGAKVLTVQMQDGMPQLWAIVHPGVDGATQRRRFAIVATGGPMPEWAEYIGTIQLRDGLLVFHVFEVMA